MRKPAFIILTLLQQVVREAREAQFVVARTKHVFRRRKVVATVLKEEL
jgi:hypothetical protein